MFKINSIRKIIVHVRECTKFIVLIILAAFLIAGAVSYIYKPTYSVTLDGELIGYTSNKRELQEKINEYIEKGNGSNVAFVEIDKLPEYSLCLLKKDVECNDDEIFNKVVEQGQTFYKYYAVAVSNEEKSYVSSFDEAEEVVNELKEKDSNNKDDLSIVEKYEKELKDFTSVEDCVDELYEEKIVETYVLAAAGVNSSDVKVPLGISLIRPVSGVVTSRFGARWGRSHKGLDIGADYGTTIYAAAAGTVTVSEYGYNGGYGNYVVINHGNGVSTLYGHCSSLIANTGEYVAQGQPIARVGSTGDSTGNHLHLEIRVDGIAQDPQNYLY